MYESCFGKTGREMTDRRQKYQGLAKIIPNLVAFDLAYLREIGARQW